MPEKKILNEAQTKAITFGKGPLLIIAGAGTGKTTVITERIKHLILKENILPSQILALTFTEKASREMEERIDVAMPYGYTQMWISTFHAFCDRVLRNEAVHIGLSPAYKLMTEAESLMFLRSHIFDLKLDYFRPLGNPHKFLEGMLQHFSRLKDEDISPEEYLEYSSGISNDKFQMSNQPIEEDEIKKIKELANAYKTYEELKAKEGVMDFSDMIGNTLKLFRSRKNILKSYQDQFKYILVDEFQDTNYAQNMLAILLSGEAQNITVVGDDDQAIYRWRGAAISNMIQFRKHFPKTHIITLTQNYRSTQEILDTSHTLVAHNDPDRLEVQEHIDKRLIANRKGKSYTIEFLYENRVEDEAEATIKKILELVKKETYAYKDVAILVRANDHATPFIKVLQRHAIPYQFLGPGRLFRQEEIKDLIAYLKILYNFEDSASVYRVLTSPTFGIDTRMIAGILNFARRKNYSLFEALERIASENQQELFMKDTEKEKIQNFVAMVHRHLKKVPTESAGQILYYYIEDTGLLKKFLAAKTETEVKHYQNIAKLFEKLKTFEAEHEDARIFPVIEWIDLSMQMGESPLASDTDWADNNAVNILTIHSSKGLEFPIVFLVNLVSQRFPTRERREQLPIPASLIKEILPVGDYHLQEERRLFYVGMTRARDHLYFTAAKYYGEGKRDRKISPFVAEALGQTSVDALLKKQQAEQAVVQPTLLDWANTMHESVSEKKAVMPPITYISYSQLQTFDMCPLHYKLQYLLRIPGQPSAPLSFGTSLHAALRDFYQAWMRDPKIRISDVDTFLEKVWINEGYTSKAHAHQALQQAKYLLQQYLQKHLITDGSQKPVAIEVPFSFFISDQNLRPNGVKIGGRIDRVDQKKDGSIEIIDYKTGKNMPSEKDLLTNLQLTLYALAATQVKDTIFNKQANQVILSLHYLEEDKILTTVRTKEQLEETKTQILQKIHEIEQSDFACSGSILCQNCEYKMLCHV